MKRGFLLSGGDLSGVRTAIIVQTGGADLLVRAIDRVRGMLPGAALTVLLQRNMSQLVRPIEGVEYLENAGSKRALASELRGRRFDAAFVLYFDHPGFWKLKLLPFALGARHVLAINEHLQAFPVSLLHPGSLLGHLAWRLGGSGSADSVTMDVAEALVRGVAKPAVIAWLAAYEKLASLRGDTRWKRRHRIR